MIRADRSQLKREHYCELCFLASTVCEFHTFTSANPASIFAKSDVELRFLVVYASCQVGIQSEDNLLKDAISTAC